MTEDFPAFLVRQAGAEEAFVLGDAQPRMALWSRHDPVSLAGALGDLDVGWAPPRRECEPGALTSRLALVSP